MAALCNQFSRGAFPISWNELNLNAACVTSHSTYPSEIKGVSVDELKTGAVAQDRSQVVEGIPQSLSGIAPLKKNNKKKQ